MAKEKKSILFYVDWGKTFNALPDDKAGQLVKHLCAFVNDDHPETDDVLINAVFANMQATLERDLDKWKAKSKKNSENALKRWAKDRPEDTTASDRIKPNANNADKEIVIDKDKVIDSVIVPLEKETKFIFKTALIKYGFKKELVEDWIKVRKTKRLTNTETAFNKFITQVEKSGKDINEILKICVEKSWGGFDSEWLTNINKQSSGVGVQKPTSRLAKVRGAGNGNG